MPDNALWFIVLWLFAVGAIVGSFLNVVIYRLPLGISIVYPPSRCPKCEKLIRWYDNVPIFGWILLRGRCRQCHNPISARYPIVEAITATMFALLAVVEMDRLDTMYPFHLLLLCTLLCAGLIEYDGNRPPWRLFLPALAVGIVAPLIWPVSRPLLKGVVDRLVGLIVGALLGSVAWRALRGRKPIGLVLGLICVGLFLGWQAVCMIAVGTAVLQLVVWALARLSLRINLAASLSLGIVTLVWLLAVGWIVLPSL
jgi:leader peptidase (prepilin peptidase)/N-methyltransferase